MKVMATILEQLQNLSDHFKFDDASLMHENEALKNNNVSLTDEANE